MEYLKLVLRASDKKYESMLDNAKHENNVLTNTIQQTEHDKYTTMARREQRKIHQMDCINKSEEECS